MIAKKKERLILKGLGTWPPSPFLFDMWPIVLYCRTSPKSYKNAQGNSTCALTVIKHRCTNEGCDSLNGPRIPRPLPTPLSASMLGPKGDSRPWTCRRLQGSLDELMHDDAPPSEVLSRHQRPISEMRNRNSYWTTPSSPKTAVCFLRC